MSKCLGHWSSTDFGWFVDDAGLGFRVYGFQSGADLELGD